MRDLCTCTASYDADVDPTSGDQPGDTTGTVKLPMGGGSGMVAHTSCETGPRFNLEEIFLYTPEVAIHEAEIPYTHFKVVDKDLDCVQTDIQTDCKPGFCSSVNTVQVYVEEKQFNILRIVPSIELVKVDVPVFSYTENGCRDREVHVKVWRHVEIVIPRNLPSIDEGDCAASQVKYTCSKTNHVVNVQQPQVQNIQVQTPVVTQPPPQPTCATCNCAAPTPICAQSGCCR